MKCFLGNHNYILMSIVPKKEAVLLKCIKCGDVKIVDGMGEHKNKGSLWGDGKYLLSENWEKISKVFEPERKDIQYMEKELEKTKNDGFNLLLQDFCSYCPDFEPEVEKLNCTAFGEATRYVNNIRCVNMKKCSRIAENLEKMIESGR